MEPVGSNSREPSYLSGLSVATFQFSGLRRHGRPGKEAASQCISAGGENQMKEIITRAGARATKKKGLIIVHTGDGKGKTTAALGVALRPCRYPMKLLLLQFFTTTRNSGTFPTPPNPLTFIS